MPEGIMYGLCHKPRRKRTMIFYDYIIIALIFCAILAEVLIVMFVSADVIIEILEGD